MSMLGVFQLLPVPAAWIGCYLLARELAARKQIDSDWRISVALASAAWGAILTCTIEFGSLARLLTGPLLFVAWVLVNLALFGMVLRLARARGAVPRQEVLLWTQSLRTKDFSEWPWDARCYVAITVAFVGFLCAVALTFATTNGDCLAYHLPRVMHWMQQQSIDHFPTNNERQIEFAPWSSFFIMTTHLLWGGDRLANLVQWCAMLGALVLLPFMLKALAFDRHDVPAPSRHRMTGFLCLTAVTLPIGLVQSMNPQTDYTTAFWLSCLVCFAIALWRDPGNGWYMLGAGLSCGLGALTKATMYIYAAPLITGFATWWLSRSIPGRLKTRLAMTFCFAFVLLNVGHAMRNISVCGFVLSSPRIMNLETNSRITASGTAANVVRNLALHSNSAVEPLTKALNRFSGWAHSLTGRSYVDPETTYNGLFRLDEQFWVCDSYAPGPYHLCLIALALVLAGLRPRYYLTALTHAAWILASFVLLCVYLKWQLWHGRLHLAYFLLVLPVAVWVVVERLPRFGIVLIALGLTFFGTYTLAKNGSRPLLEPSFVLLPREDQYMSVYDRQLNELTRQLAEEIIASGCQNVGLKLSFDDPEYPLWIMLRNRGFRGTIHHVLVENPTRRITQPEGLPPVIIAAGTPSPGLAALYPVTMNFGRLTLLAKNGWSSPSLQAFSQSKRVQENQ